MSCFEQAPLKRHHTTVQLKYGETLKKLFPKAPLVPNKISPFQSVEVQHSHVWMLSALEATHRLTPGKDVKSTEYVTCLVVRSSIVQEDDTYI